MPIHPDLLEIVRCPKCRGAVVEKKTADGDGLACASCKLLYAIVDDVPNFLIDEAKPLAAGKGT